MNADIVLTIAGLALGILCSLPVSAVLLWFGIRRAPQRPHERGPIIITPPPTRTGWALHVYSKPVPQSDLWTISKPKEKQ